MLTISRRLSVSSAIENTLSEFNRNIDVASADVAKGSRRDLDFCIANAKSKRDAYIRNNRDEYIRNYSDFSAVNADYLFEC